MANVNTGNNAQTGLRFENHNNAQNADFILGDGFGNPYVDFKLNGNSYKIVNDTSETNFKQFNIFNCNQTYPNELLTLRNENTTNAVNAGIQIGAYTQNPQKPCFNILGSCQDVTNNENQVSFGAGSGVSTHNFLNHVTNSLDFDGPQKTSINNSLYVNGNLSTGSTLVAASGVPFDKSCN